MKQYMPNGAPNFGSTQPTQGTDASVISPDRANSMETGDAAQDQDGAEVLPNPNVDEEDGDNDLDGEEYQGGAGF
ncbi:unnamed protein product [Arabidopsis halleri]